MQVRPVNRLSIPVKKEQKKGQRGGRKRAVQKKRKTEGKVDIRV